jgi:hypothetical protein
MRNVMSIEAAAELCLVLRELECDVEHVRRPAGVRVPGGPRMEVVEAPTSTSAAVRRTLERSSEAAGVLVTNFLCPAHRVALEEGGAGWLDRRGHIRVPSLRIDGEVAPMVAPASARADVWERRGVIAVALALLQQEGPVPTTWDLGFYAGLTGSGATLVLQALRSLDMIDEHDHPRREALFTELATRWHTRWYPLAHLPAVSELDEEARLLIAGQDDLRQPGWALIPPTSRGEHPADEDPPPRLLLADQRALAWLLRVFGHITGPGTAALVAAAPSPVAVAQRQRPIGNGVLPVVHPVVAALEQAVPGHPADFLAELPPLTTK